MRSSIIVAAHNEGERLWRTVESCLETAGDLGEIVVADDASTDGGVDQVRRRFPRVRVLAHRQRMGCSATKDLGARKSRGRVLVFLDGHCKPERWAIERLINAVEDFEGRAIVTPSVPALDCESWENSGKQIGHGYYMELWELKCGWIPLSEMRPCGDVAKGRQPPGDQRLRPRFYECPALIGCCLALTRKLYARLRGFDPHMVDWGVEDLDFGLKSWLMGYPILHDALARVGHRFRTAFDNFSVAEEASIVNQLRMARKNFSDGVWNEWLEHLPSRFSAELWEKAWARFSAKRASAERERRYLLRRRQRDEFWYAQRFQLDWPRLRPPTGD